MLGNIFFKYKLVIPVRTSFYLYNKVAFMLTLLEFPDNDFILTHFLDRPLTLYLSPIEHLREKIVRQF